MLQTKLEISAPGDQHEQEAERVADQVMRMPAPRLQRACACSGERAGCLAADPGHTSRRLQASGSQVRTTGHGAAPPIVQEVLAGPGRSLDPATRAFFEPRFGHDFGDVHIHTGERAGASARAVGALAYTVGRDVVFAPGRFEPGTEHGRRLLAHELVHVVQQGGEGAAEIARVPDRSGTRDGRYTFSTNCGWIDWGHAAPDLCLRLIERVRQGSDALRAAGAAATPAGGQLTTPPMTSSVAGVVLSSASVQVRLLRPLSASEVNEVALSIFKTLSIAFETQQIWTDLLGASSFSQEDLPSNLIGFYRALRGFDRNHIMGFCSGLDVAASLAEFERQHEFVRNFSFTPVGATGPWPAELSTINDGAAAALYETQRIVTSQGSDSFTFCPMYRIVGTIGETDLFFLSAGGTTFSAADDLRVLPTFRQRETTSGRYGHVRTLEVGPARASDEAQLREAGLRWPLDLPQPVLQCLTSQGNPG